MTSYWRDAGDFPSSVGTICLPTRRMPIGERVTATGWGGTNAAETQSTELKEVHIISNVIPLKATHSYSFHKV